MSKASDKRGWKPAALAARWDLPRGTVYQMLRDGRLKGLTHPQLNVIRVPDEEVRRFDAAWQAVDGRPIRASRRTKLKAVTSE